MLGKEQERLLGRQTPGGTKSFSAVAGAEFLERGIPRRAVAFLSAGGGGDQPPQHYLLKEPIPEQAFAIEAFELLRLENATPVPLRLAEDIEGFGELLVRQGHWGLEGSALSIWGVTSILCRVIASLLCCSGTSQVRWVIASDH
jgi:hypothetical protein